MSANYSTLAKSAPPAVCFNKGLLTQSQAHLFASVCGYFSATGAELNNCNRDFVRVKSKILIICPQEKDFFICVNLMHVHMHIYNYAHVHLCICYVFACVYIHEDVH